MGVCTAFSLAERGVQVTLVEKGAICSGASHGNAGWIFPSHSVPIPGPGVIRKSAGWLLDPESPLYIKPRASLSLARWLLRFARACNETAMRRTTALRRELSTLSLARFEKLAALPGLECGFKQLGLLIVCATKEGLAQAHEELELLEALGGKGERFTAEAVRERIPVVAPDLAGGVFLPNDAHVTPGDFVRGLAAELDRRGVTLLTGTEVLDLEWSRRSGPRLQTTRGELGADELVLATGAWTPSLARRVGIRVPIESAKGYSITVRRPEVFGELPVILSEAKVGVTPMGQLLRFAGTLELAGLDLSVNLRRVRALDRAVRHLLPGLPETEHVETWRGLRPLTPDDLPIIGRPDGTTGLVLATGHGMSGVSQGPITGELVAQLLCGEPSAVDLAPFSPDRF